MRRRGFLGNTDFGNYGLIRGGFRRLPVSPQNALRYLDLAHVGVVREVVKDGFPPEAGLVDTTSGYIPEYMRYSKVFPNFPLTNPTPVAQLRDPMTFNILMV